MKNNKFSRLIVMLLTALAWLGFAGAITSVRGQDLICCDMWIDADGKWFGARRDCSAALAELSAASRARACRTIKASKRRGGFMSPFTDSANGLACCPEAAQVCGDASLDCTDAPDRPGPKRACEAGVTPTITIDLEETLNIDESPYMPQIVAKAKVTPSDADVSWTAQITFSAPGGSSCSGGPKFDSPKVTGEGEVFTPGFGEIYGGTLEITASTTCGTGATTTITRNVGGLNADPTEVRNEIGTMEAPFEADDLKKIACHESRQRQFTGSNRPTMGPSNDAGIMQICYQRTVADIWNWKTNVARGRANLLAAANYSRQIPLYTRRGYYVVGGARTDYSPHGQGPPWEHEPTNFTPEQLRLEAIKRYNAGYSPNKGYWRWDDAAGTWVADPQGGGDPNYVAHVLGQLATCPN